MAKRELDADNELTLSGNSEVSNVGYWQILLKNSPVETVKAH
jgi:hypothetical protein